MTGLRSDREGQARTLGVSDVNALAVMDIDHRHPVAVEVGPVQRAVVDCQPTALIEPQDQMRARDARIGDAHIGLHVATDDHLVAGREGSLGPVMPNCQDGRGKSSHYSSIGPCWQCALLDPAVTSLCFDSATHSPFIACCDESPTAVRHYSIGRVAIFDCVRACRAQCGVRGQQDGIQGPIVMRVPVVCDPHHIAATPGRCRDTRGRGIDERAQGNYAAHRGRASAAEQSATSP